MLRDLIELSRPRDWVKNVFVLMPVPFALASGAALHPQSFALGLLGFCLANSAVYAFNDSLDAERDRLHPEKRHRPVASGRVTKRAARLCSLCAALVGMACMILSGRPAAVMVGLTYLTLSPLDYRP